MAVLYGTDLGLVIINNYMFYTIYKITNTINNKIYVGKHQTEEPNDAYYGSGNAIIESIKIHGKENFNKEVLFIFETEKEMNEKEAELITEEFIKRSDTYNIGLGGAGGPHFLGKTHSEENKKHFRKTSKQNYEMGYYNTFNFAGHQHTNEAKEKISKAQQARKGKYMWINNGTKTKTILISSEIPKGWNKGRKF